MSCPIGNDEHLDRKHTHIAERFRNSPGDPARLTGDRGRHVGGYPRNLEDMVAVLILGDIETLDFAIAATG